MMKPLSRPHAERLNTLEVDVFMHWGGNRWASEFASHAQEQRRIEAAIKGQGFGVPARVYEDEED